jgi:hypothetical protein
MWHPHLHGIVLCTDQPDMFRLRRESEDITKDSYQVDVRPISGDPVESFVEVFKYALKFSDLTLSDNWEASLILQGRQLLVSFGLFRGVKIPHRLTDELLDDLPYVELFYRYFDGRYQRCQKVELCHLRVTEK